MSHWPVLGKTDTTDQGLPLYLPGCRLCSNFSHIGYVINNNIRQSALHTAITVLRNTASSKLRMGQATTTPEYILVADAELASEPGESG